jgi:hypothetical protein
MMAAEYRKEGLSMTEEQAQEFLDILREIADSMDHLVRFVDVYATLTLKMPHVPSPEETRTRPSHGPPTGQRRS